ncbi:hypothetical protein lbkm_2947 [Lachnospiraceae bacterium KM106-2]|nr:hypothetical protein lbkm_2947 [Lachnospiraceae bacterium KM106-2]
MIEQDRKHTFAICAYKESEYLEECILSLKNQTTESNIIMITSTPNALIEGLAQKYNIPLFSNEGNGGIANDWNFAYAHAESKYVTIAHQDDLYEKDYARQVIQRLEKASNPLICFTDYGELRNGNKINENKLLKIKRMLLIPMKLPGIRNLKFIHRRILSLGNPICCPSVTYVRENLPEVVFHAGYLSNIDWEAWEMMTRLKGKLIYSNQILMYHRIHEESTTSEIIGDNQRTNEDYEMFCKFWPKWIAKKISRIYSKSEESNNL